jgi:uncharacterized membrane protein YuzA (DUF378 family)
MTMGSRILNIVTGVLLVIGGLNWGLLGIFGFDLVGAVFGSMTFLSRLVYALVGVSAVYQAIRFPAVSACWLRAPLRPVHTARPVPQHAE